MEQKYRGESTEARDVADQLVTPIKEDIEGHLRGYLGYKR